MSVLTDLARKISLPHVFVVFIALSSCITAQEGSDLVNYVNWAKVSVSGDINQGQPPQPFSMRGIQFRHWSAGPGLFIAPFRIALSPFGLERHAGFAAGYVCTISFWCLLFFGLKRLSDDLYALLGVSLCFVATSLGFYGCYTALETFSLLPAVILFYESTKLFTGERINLLVTGTATAVLLMFRPYLGAYAWCALVPALIGQCRSNDVSLLRRFLNIVALLLPVALAIWQIGSVHSWMTADFFQSPYHFGDEHFQSIDPSCPYLWNVLFSSFHGALIYSPITGIGLIAATILAGLATGRRDWPIVSFWSLLLLAVCCNIYIAGCWHNWWMAAWFGNRNLYLPAVVAVAAMIKCVQSSRGAARSVMLAICAISSIWSFLLLQRGRVSYFTYEWMMRDVRIDLQYWSSVEMCVVFVTCAVFAVTTVVFINGDCWLKITTVVAVGLSLCYLADRISVTQAAFILFLGAIFLSLIAGICHIDVLVRYLRVVAPIAFFVMIALFCRLYIQTERQTSDYPSGAFFPDYDLLYNVKSLKGVPIIEKEREGILQFLRREKGEHWYREFQIIDEELPILIRGRSYPGRKTLSGYHYL